MPLVRVVIPTYNRAALVAEAIASVLDQHFRDFEVVIVDDGSTDDTSNVLGRFSANDARVRSLTLPHGGAAKARNAAIEEPGQHHYVAFLDADDLWHPDHLEKAVETLEDQPTIALFFGGYERPDRIGLSSNSKLQSSENRRSARTRASHLLMNDLYLLEPVDCVQAFLRSEFAPHTATVVVRCAAVKRKDWFDVNLEVYEDLEFFLHLAATGSKFAWHDAIHCCVRRFGDNLTGSTDLSSAAVRRRYQSVANYHKMKLSLCNGSKDREFVWQEIAHAFFIIGECSREQSDLRAARDAYRNSLRCWSSYRALRGLVLSFLPNEAYSLLTTTKHVLQRARPH
jgi:glycosyltransferase involved in cell wall biosynthesis